MKRRAWFFPVPTPPSSFFRPRHNGTLHVPRGYFTTTLKEAKEPSTSRGWRPAHPPPLPEAKAGEKKSCAPFLWAPAGSLPATAPFAHLVRRFLSFGASSAGKEGTPVRRRSEVVPGRRLRLAERSWQANQCPPFQRSRRDG